MDTELRLGLVGVARLDVEAKYTAREVASGEVDVLATPVMIRLMEEASVNAVRQMLPEGKATVGMHLNVKHIAPTPIGLRVEARAELVAIDGLRLTFQVEAHDSQEQIGIGTHRRVIIDLADFQARAQAKRLS